MLLRDPIKVKRMTRAGQSVQVTDNGRPLWILKPAEGTRDDQRCRELEFEKELKSVLKEEPSSISLSRIMLDSRR